MPGRCEIGDRELELHPADGHTADGMADLRSRGRSVLVAGDYLSPVEIPTLNEGGTIDAYLATLERLRPLLARAEHVVPGHGPVLDGARALAVLEEDVALPARRCASAAPRPSCRRAAARAARSASLHARERRAPL